ncbi:RNA polymerase-associated protein RTF1-like protein [Platysternon megacephalum]|uniref:RNA polymerase-associated protein RTF1-like protein n=1 Tax=Platysternon megacephalum TaxID=55544 RepID=A0A4D9DHW1_9SAUR|nr:RNA polymerase-associated protein RTF1-like protein [Platysternon megacephalum]
MGARGRFRSFRGMRYRRMWGAKGRLREVQRTVMGVGVVWDQVASPQPGGDGVRWRSLSSSTERQCSSVSSCCKLITCHGILMPTGGAGVMTQEAPLILQFSGLD